jgi:hypothetical protein
MIGVAVLVVYTLWSGSALKSLTMPGGFKAEFERGGMNSGNPLKELSDEDIKQHQRELEQKLRDIEDHAGISAAGEPRVGGPRADGQSESHSQAAAQNPRSGYPALTGTWMGANSLTYVITQSGSSVTVSEVSPLYGITAVGQGIIDGGHLSASYRTALDTVGTADLDLSEDGRQLTGKFTDSYSGISIPAVLQR